ncbi:helix-turn-helix transcriptional regulator [Chryseobacterium gotjawalense]|uniref:Helix-turn-helix transcriptional regulator n=1 Tax=Chryseobacterium gotjawalense TaxID=3042315 RepID=A0ABY8RC03_9FLAO|nr:AraC family transcriptional regulator [Chryseobacterium sp. wdc7]WHF51493.1 helix-turn-helix transcriptional regulator [Chryseobacterium sp. wdc7]
MVQPFSIFQLTEEEIHKKEAFPAHLCQHDFEELVIGIEGNTEHFIDYKTTALDAPFVSFITKGKLHRLLPTQKEGLCKWWVLRFKSEFIPETTFQLYSCYHNRANMMIQHGIGFDRMVALTEMMFTEMQQPIPNLGVIRHLLCALLLVMESESKKAEAGEMEKQKKQSTVFKKFLELLEENFHRHEGVAFYAEKLSMSARNLNLICEKILHQTVTETIEARKLIEAKNLLINSDKTIAEIGFELGFNEKGYFTSVFKKKSGQTPSEFRDEMKKLIS